MGSKAAPFILLLIGVLWLVIGLVLESTILSTASTAGSASEIGSFAGAQSINDLMPLIYNMVLAVGAVGLIGAGVVTGYRRLKG